MAGRMLEVLAHMPQLIDTVGRMSSKKILDLIDSPAKAELQTAA